MSASSALFPNNPATTVKATLFEAKAARVLLASILNDNDGATTYGLSSMEIRRVQRFLSKLSFAIEDAEES